MFSLATTSVASKIQVLLQQNLSSKNLQVMQNSKKKKIQCFWNVNRLFFGVILVVFCFGFFWGEVFFFNLSNSR